MCFQGGPTTKPYSTNKEEFIQEEYQKYLTSNNEYF